MASTKTWWRRGLPICGRRKRESPALSGRKITYPRSGIRPYLSRALLNRGRRRSRCLMTEPGTASPILEAVVERREALGPPSVGSRAPEAATPGNRDLAVSAQNRTLARSGGGFASPWRLPGAPSPRLGKRKKGTDARRASLNRRRAERWLRDDLLRTNPNSRCRRGGGAPRVRPSR